MSENLLSRLEQSLRQSRAARMHLAARLRELEAENAKLKRMYADLALENAAIREVLSRKL